MMLVGYVNRHRISILVREVVRAGNHGVDRLVNREPGPHALYRVGGINIAPGLAAGARRRVELIGHQIFIVYGIRGAFKIAAASGAAV